MIEITIRKVGSSLGTILPAEVIRSLGVGAGDRLFLTQGPDGYRITRYDPEFKEQMEASEECMKEYGNALRELGK